MWKVLQMNIVIRLGRFHLLMSVLGSIGSVMHRYWEHWEWKHICTGNSLAYADWQSIFKGIDKTFSAESAFFALILSNAITEDFITASFQTDNQNRMNK